MIQLHESSDHPRRPSGLPPTSTRSYRPQARHRAHARLLYGVLRDWRQIGLGSRVLRFAGSVLLVGSLTALSHAQLDPFARVTEGELVEYQGSSRGAAWGDFDGDGDPDLFVSHPTYDGPSQRNALFRNDSGTLVPVQSEVSHARPAGWEGATWIDVDGDGDLDLHTVGRNGAGSQFFENRNGVLTTLDRDPFDGAVTSASMTCWADADGDGWLDPFVVGSGEDTNHLFRNLGDWRMEPVALSPEGEGGGRSRSCAWVALGGERLPSLVIANARQPNVLLRNEGGMRLRDDPTSAVRLDERYSYGLSTVDANGDGIQDVFVANFDADNSLLLGTPDGRLDPTELGTSLQSAASKGHVWGDFDHDGRIDLYLGSGTPRPGMLNRLWRGDSHGGFVLDMNGAYAQDADTSAAVAGADMDGDGDIDLFVANWGSAGSQDRLYRNQGADGHWLQVDLEGRAPNTMGVGTQVSIRSNQRGEPVWQHRWLGLSTGYAGQNEPRLHFGLGDATVVDSLIVRWPSGATSTRTRVASDQTLRVAEPR